MSIVRSNLILEMDDYPSFNKELGLSIDKYDDISYIKSISGKQKFRSNVSPDTSYLIFNINHTLTNIEKLYLEEHYLVNQLSTFKVEIPLNGSQNFYVCYGGKPKFTPIGGHNWKASVQLVEVSKLPYKFNNYASESGVTLHISYESAGSSSFLNDGIKNQISLWEGGSNSGDYVWFDFNDSVDYGYRLIDTVVIYCKLDLGYDSYNKDCIANINGINSFSITGTYKSDWTALYLANYSIINSDIPGRIICRFNPILVKDIVLNISQVGKTNHSIHPFISEIEIFNSRDIVISS